MIRKSIFLMTLAVVMCFASCEKYDHAIADIEDRLDKIEGTSIKTIEQQIASINTSLTDLKSMDTALQTLIDDLEAEAANLQAELDANATADAATKKALEEKITALETLIATLQEKDTELDKKIADLETYVNDEITATEDWANTTFATLEQYEEVQTWIEAFKVAIDNLNKWTSETDLLLASKFADIEKAIADTETTMKAWVNEQLEQPLKDIAALQAALSALEGNTATDEELSTAIEAQQKKLEEAVDGLTAAYEKAIKKAIEDNKGVIDTAISAAITAATSDLQNEINGIKSEITLIKSRLDALENRIQSLTYIPTHTDGKATLTYNSTSENWETSLSFFVTPKSVVGNIKQKHISVKGVYTASTRAVDLTDLLVTAFESDATNGTITVTVSGKNLSQDFFNGNTDVAVFLIISDGNNEFVSDYVPLALLQTYTYDQASNTYTVYTAKGLYVWNEALQTDFTANLVLAADITLPNKDLTTGEEITVTDGKPSGSNWKPFGFYDYSTASNTTYNGTIDGGGHTISGIRINTNEKAGLVKGLGGSGIIKNLTIEDVVIYSSAEDVAAFVADNHGIIENCYVKGEASSICGGYYAGGIAGYMNNKLGNAEIVACSNMATVTVHNSMSDHVGGIVGITSYMGSTYRMRVIGCWTKDTNETDGGTKDGIGRNDSATVAGVFSVTDATTANSKIAEMNQALEDAGYSYRWETVAGGWPVVKK